MNLRHSTRWILCLGMMAIGGFAVRAAPPGLPPNAIAEDTFFVATVDLSKVDPATLEATVKAALGEKAGDAEAMLKTYKAHYEKYAGSGAQTATVVLRGDPDQQRQGPEPIFYIRFKPGADQAAAEKQIREDEGENNPAAMEITHDGDFMVLRKKGQEPPEAGSEERAKLFAEAMGESGKPAVGALIFNEALLKAARKAPQQGQPPGFQTLVSDAKWFRIEMALGEAANAEVTIQTADEETGKRMAETVTGLGEFMKSQIAQMKQQFAQLPPQALAQMGPMGEMAHAMTAIAEAFKPTQAGSKVALTFDAKAVGGMLRTFLIRTQMMGAQTAPVNKGGL